MLVSTAADIQPALGVRPLNSLAGIEVWGLVDPVELAFQANEELNVEGWPWRGRRGGRRGRTRSRGRGGSSPAGRAVK